MFFKVQKQIQDGNTDKAFEILLEHGLYINKKHNKDILLLSGSYKRLKIRLVRGFITHEEYETQINRINYFLLEIIEKPDFNLLQEQEKPNKFKLINIVLATALLAFILALIYVDPGKLFSFDRPTIATPEKDTPKKDSLIETSFKKDLHGSQQKQNTPFIPQQPVESNEFVIKEGNIGVKCDSIMVEITSESDELNKYRGYTNKEGFVSIPIPHKILKTNEYLNVKFHLKSELLCERETSHKDNPTFFELPQKIIVNLQKKLYTEKQ